MRKSSYDSNSEVSNYRIIGWQAGRAGNRVFIIHHSDIGSGSRPRLMALREDASTGEMVDDGKGEAASDSKSMAVKVYSPFKVYYDGRAVSISAESDTGPFDILPKHHNFITLLSPCDLIVRADADHNETFRIDGGIMHVKADDVIVFLDV